MLPTWNCGTRLTNHACWLCLYPATILWKHLETHEVSDVLPDRTAETLTTWLRQHPEVEIMIASRRSYVSRARANFMLLDVEPISGTVSTLATTLRLGLDGRGTRTERWRADGGGRSAGDLARPRRLAQRSTGPAAGRQAAAPPLATGDRRERASGGTGQAACGRDRPAGAGRHSCHKRQIALTR
jgi:hypothetical protein